MKKCSKCQCVKPFIEFSKNKSKKDGYASWCKQCNKTEQHKWYVKNAEEHKKRATTYKQKVRGWLNEYKAKQSCFLCGFNHPAALDFHHTKDKNFRIAQMEVVGCSISTLEQELSKCIVLCANCHRIHHYNQKMGV